MCRMAWVEIEGLCTRVGARRSVGTYGKTYKGFYMDMWIVVVVRYSLSTCVGNVGTDREIYMEVDSGLEIEVGVRENVRHLVLLCSHRIGTLF